MANADNQGTITLKELLVTSLAQIDAVAKLLIEKGVFTQDEFMEKIKAERATYQAIYGGRNRGRLTSISYFLY